MGTTVVWKHNGTVINTRQYNGQVKGLLPIENLSKEDAGVYECLASNNAGSVDTNITFIILSK